MIEDARPTILIVDDDRVNRVALAVLFQEDCRLFMAKDGRSAMQILGREPVDLVLLDVSMPGLDGHEVLHQIKSQPETAGIAVIFITGLADEADEEKGLRLGASDYIQKPFRPAVVRARVMLHLKLAQQRRELEQLALQDSLTGIANRRYFDLILDQALRRTARGGDPLGMAIFDVDHFKQYNDLHGHDAGDEALRQIAQVLSGFARRGGDVAARYGGEEFVLLLPDAQGFDAIAERVRADIMARRIPHGRSPVSNYLTVSGGAVVVPTHSAPSRRAVVQSADRLLYRAKQEGRNRVFAEIFTRPPARRPTTPE